jgi:hypothetical protein
VIAVLPHMLGYVLSESLVVAGLGGPGRVGPVFRYDLLPVEQMPWVVDHATSVFARRTIQRAVFVGYGTGVQITPRADAFRRGAARAGLVLCDVLRVDEGRYWSYLCTELSCHPAEGTPLEAERPAQALLDAIGPVRASRQELAAIVAPLAGRQATVMKQAGQRADRAWRRLADRGGADAVYRAGLTAVRSAVSACLSGTKISDDHHAWLARVLTDVRVRDFAMSHITAEDAEAHMRLWGDLVRRAQPGQAAAPATLLAYAAVQDGQGTLASLALDRALADDPRYSMAQLLGYALEAGVDPRNLARLMTPGQVVASYPQRQAAAGIEAGQ